METPSFDDLEKLQQEILSSNAEASEPKPKIQKQPTQKQKILADILELQDKVYPDPGDRRRRAKSSMEKWKFPQLEKRLGELTEASVGLLTGAPAASTPTQAQVDDGAVRLLVVTQMQMAALCENLSVDYRSYIGTDLEGFTNNLSKQREELLQITAEIYSKYGENIKVYLTPEARLGIFYLMTLSATLVENMKKKETGTSNKSEVTQSNVQQEQSQSPVVQSA